MAARMSPENRQNMHDEMAKLSTPERIDRMNTLKAQHDAEMAKRQQATKAFYAGLTPEQQKVFDANAMGRGHGKRGPQKG
jgi:Spy/CpxP family protein refolding chaperone